MIVQGGNAALSPPSGFETCAEWQTWFLPSFERSARQPLVCEKRRVGADEDLSCTPVDVELPDKPGRDIRKKPLDPMPTANRKKAAVGLPLYVIVVGVADGCFGFVEGRRHRTEIVLDLAGWRKRVLFAGQNNTELFGGNPYGMLSQSPGSEAACADAGKQTTQAVRAMRKVT